MTYMILFSQLLWQHNYVVKLATKIEYNKIICGYTITIPFSRE